MTLRINSLEDAHNVIQEAMKDVKQELIIVDGDETHLVYIYKINLVKGRLNVEYSSPSEKDISELVHKAVKAQLEQHYEEPKPWLKRFSKIFSSMAHTLRKFGRT